MLTLKNLIEKTNVTAEQVTYLRRRKIIVPENQSRVNGPGSYYHYDDSVVPVIEKWLKEHSRRTILPG